MSTVGCWAVLVEDQQLAHLPGQLDEDNYTVVLEGKLRRFHFQVTVAEIID